MGVDPRAAAVPGESRFQSRLALVTGGGGGVGASVCRRLAAEGAHVLVADIDLDAADVVAYAIRAEGRLATAVRLDVTSESSWGDVMASLETVGRLDILVNSAGVMARQGVGTTDVGVWNTVLGVNLLGPVLGMKAFVPVTKGEGGSIVNIGSTAALQAHTSAAYCASKWALRGVSRTAAVEFADAGVRVNCVHPGLMPTALSESGGPVHVDATLAVTPLGTLTTPEEVAGVVAFLASHESGSVTGADIVVDGGYTVGGAAWHRRAVLAGLSEAMPGDP